MSDQADIENQTCSYGSEELDPLLQTEIDSPSNMFHSEFNNNSSRDITVALQYFHNDVPLFY